MNSSCIVINQSSKQAVIANKADNLIVINTDDAIYIGEKGKSSEIKDILKKHPELKAFSDNSTVFYRS